MPRWPSSRLRGFPDLWTYAPLEFLAPEGLHRPLPLRGLYNVFRRLPFPRNGSFYSAAALFFLLVDIGVVAAVQHLLHLLFPLGLHIRLPLRRSRATGM